MTNAPESIETDRGLRMLTPLPTPMSRSGNIDAEPARSAQAAPFIEEMQERVDLPGVQLFMHVFGAQMQDAPLRSSRFTIEPGCGTEQDRHAVREIWFVSAGSLDVCYDGAWHRVTAGQAVFFEAWRPHFTRNVGDETAQIFSVWWP